MVKTNEEFEEILYKRNEVLKDALEKTLKAHKSANYMTITSFFMCILSVIMAIFFLNNDEDYIDKNDIKNQLTKIIKNGADLEQVKHVYENRNRERIYFYKIFKKEESEKEYYKQDVGLNVILQDLLVDYYINKDMKCDTMLYANLVTIIDEYKLKNPFDNLEENQRFYFENIFYKLGEEYYEIEQDIFKIADELKYKNGLTNRYLNLSEESFMISIIALIITILFSIWQITQGHYSSKIMKDLFEKMKEKESHIEENKEL